MNSGRPWGAIAAGIICFGLLIAVLFLSTPRALPPLLFTTSGRTNELSGGSKVWVRVVNTSGRTQNYAYWAQILGTNGWADATNWEAQHPGRLYWIRSHATNEIVLRAPEGESVWRLKFMRELQPSSLEWKWYALVRRTGLRRIGLREQPPRSYFFTDQIAQ